MRTRGPLLFAFLALTAWSPIAHGQQRGSDVGGVPARRRITKYPTLKKFVAAEYPSDEKSAGISAAVILAIEISATGDVTKVTVAQSAGRHLDDAAVAAATQFQFEPAEVDDKPAPAKIAYRYEFTIKPDPEPAAPAEESPQARAIRAAYDLAKKTPASTPAEEVEVRAAPRPRRDAVQTSVSSEQARRVAGTQGDVLKVVQNLPGVSRPPLASGQLVVWGSAPNDTRVYIDGVEIPALYHGSGLRSVVNSDLVSSVELVPGAFGAEYGRGLGGLVRVETRALQKEGIHGYVGADTLDASAMASAALSDRVRVGIAGRYSYLDSLLAATSAPDVGDFFPIPRYRDYQAKASVDLRRNESIDMVFLGSRDDLRRTVPSSDPARVESETNGSSFHRLYLRYDRLTDDGAVNVTPFAGYDRSELATAFSGTSTRLEIGSWKYGVRSSYRTRLNPRITLTTGLDALGSSSDITRSGSLTLPAREGDITVFGQAPGDAVNSDTWSTNIVNVGPHVIADVQMGKWTVTPGVRFDMFLIEGSRLTPRVGQTPAIGFSRLAGAVDPRLSVRYQATRELAVTASGGTYHQAPEPEDLSAVFGTPELGLSRAAHAALGESLRITPTLSAEVTGFYKSMSDLVVRSQLTAPTLARLLVQDGEGRSYGVVLLLRQEMWRGFFGWISYSISRSERRYVGDESYRLFDFDEPHVLAAVASQELGRWTFGVRLRYASGSPRTPVVGGFYDGRGDEYQPIFGPQNSIRIPAFYQLDAKVERLFPLGNHAKVIIFADVQNVTFHENKEEIVYSENLRRRDYLTGLPTLAVVGGRVEF